MLSADGDPGVETFNSADLLIKAILCTALIYSSMDTGGLGISRRIREDLAGQTKSRHIVRLRFLVSPRPSATQASPTEQLQSGRRWGHDGIRIRDGTLAQSGRRLLGGGILG